MPTISTAPDDVRIPASEVARMLGLSSKTVLRWAETGHRDFPRALLSFSSHRRFSRQAVLDWMAAQADE